MAELKLITLENLTTFAGEIKAKYAKQSDYLTLKDKVDELVEGGGEPNKIEVIKVNGTAQSITAADKSVDIKVPVAVSELTNDEEFQTKTEVSDAIDAKISSTYKPGGSVEASKFATAPAQTEEGKVYNASEKFSTNANFVDGLDKSYPAGTNVVVINDNGSYKYDVLAGFVDLSSYATTTAVSSSIASAKEDLESKISAAQSAAESYTDTALEDYTTTEGLESMLEDYVKSDALDSELGDYVDRSELTSTLADYVKGTDISTISESEIKALLA